MRIHLWSYILDNEGRPVSNADISVYLAGSNTAAKIYTTEYGGSHNETTPQLTTNSQGFFEFWVGDSEDTNGYSVTQKFKIVWEKTGTQNGIIDYVDAFSSSFPAPVDETDVNTEKDKAVSNFLAKKWTDHVDDTSLDQHTQYLYLDGRGSTQTIDDSVIITGSLTVQGEYFVTTTEYVSASDNTIFINAGEAGAGVTAGESGIEVDRGTLTNYKFIFDETTDSFKIGEVGDLQKVATRQDSPIDKGIVFWNDTETRFDTSSSLTWNGSQISISGDIETTGKGTFDSIQFELVPEYTGDVGQIWWDNDRGTLNLGMIGGNAIQQIGLETYFYVKNQTGSDLTDGKPVMQSGSLGASGKLTAQYAIADGSIFPNKILGIMTETVTNENSGFCTSFGVVRGIQTNGANYSETWNDGDIIYVSPTVAGNLTNVEPNAPNLSIKMGYVVDAAGSNGTLFVQPSWNCSLTNLSDVDGTSLTTSGQIPVWDNSNSYFDFTENIYDYFKNDGNSFGDTAILGTTDDNELRFIINSTEVMALSSTGMSVSGNIDMNDNYIELGNGYIGFDGTASEGLTFDTNGNVTFTGNVTLADSKYLYTDRVQARDSGGLELYEDGGKGIFIQDSTARVGFGTNSPDGDFHIFESGGNPSIFLTTDTNNAPYINTDANRSGSGASLFSMQSLWDGTRVCGMRFVTGDDAVNKDEGEIEFFTRTDGDADWQNRVNIDKEGNLGVGVTPEEKFHIDGHFKVENGSIYLDNNAGIRFENVAGTSVLSMALDSSDILRFGSKSDGEFDGFIFHTSLKDDAVRITDSGNLGVGELNPDASLHVNQGDNSAAMPVFHLEQDDVSEEFIRLTGQAASATLTQSLVDESDVTTPTLVGYFKVNVQDEGNQITDGSYFVPFYSLA